MKRKVSIKSNILLNVIFTSSNFILPLITYPYVTRVLMPEGMGKVNFVQACLAVFSHIAALGVSSYGTRECAKARQDKEQFSKLVHEIFFINMAATFLAYVLLLLSVLIIPKFNRYKLLFVTMGIGIFLTTLGVEWVYEAMEMYAYITIRSIAFKIVSVALIFLMVNDQDDYLIYGVLTIFTASASNILNFINIRKYVSFTWYGKYELRKHLGPIFVLFISALAITVYNQVDSVMLEFMRGERAVGIYGVAFKIKAVISSVLNAVSIALVPRMSIYFGNKQKKEYMDLLKKSWRVVLVVGVPMSLFVLMNAKDVITLVSGDRYIEASGALLILMVSTLVIAITNLAGNQILLPSGREKRYSQSVLIGLFINIVGNLLMIPRYGVVGAAGATLLTELFNMLWMGSACWEELKSVFSAVSMRVYTFALIIATIAMTIIQYFVSTLPNHWRVIVNMVVMFGLYYGILLVKREEIMMSGISSVKKLLGFREQP